MCCTFPTEGSIWKRLKSKGGLDWRLVGLVTDQLLPCPPLDVFLRILEGKGQGVAWQGFEAMYADVFLGYTKHLQLEEEDDALGRMTLGV